MATVKTGSIVPACARFLFTEIFQLLRSTGTIRVRIELCTAIPEAEDVAKSGLYTTRTVSTEEGQALLPISYDLPPKRLYHAARLRWNTIERKRTLADDQLIDDVAEWALWQYATGEYLDEVLSTN